MRPKAPAEDGATADLDMFRHQLDNMIDLRHLLARLAGLINWRGFDEAFGPLYSDKVGRPGLPTRLMAGLHLVKHVKSLSDEEVCAQFVENPYVQFFCCETHFQTRLPVDRSSMTRWRQRIGPERLGRCCLPRRCRARQSAEAGGAGKSDGRHYGADQGCCTSRRQPLAQARYRMAEPVGHKASGEVSPVLHAHCRPCHARG